MSRKINYKFGNQYAHEQGTFELPPYEDISFETIDNFIYGMAEDLVYVTAEANPDEELEIYESLYYEWNYID